MPEGAPNRSAPLAPRAAYDRWAPSYAASGRNPVTRAAARALRSVVPPVAGRRVLDVACGDGRWSRWAARHGAASVVGVDFSAGMLGEARARTPAARLAAADLRRLPFAPGSFDVVIHALALGHVPDPAPALAAAAGVLAPGGWLALVDLHPEAAARGWRRTFRDAEDRLHAVAWTPHALADVRNAAAAAGLGLRREVARPLAGADLPIGAPAAARGTWAVYAMGWVRLD